MITEIHFLCGWYLEGRWGGKKGFELGTSCYLAQRQWCDRQGSRMPQCCTPPPPPETSDWEISAELLGKKRQGKKGKGVKIEKERRKISDREISAELLGKKGKGKGVNIEKERRKIVKLKVQEGGKVKKWREYWFFFFFFFFASHFSKPLKFVLFWVYQNGNFLSGKNISRRKKIRKNDFAPQKNFPVTPLLRDLSTTMKKVVHYTSHHSDASHAELWVVSSCMPLLADHAT